MWCGPSPRRLSTSRWYRSPPASGVLREATRPAIEPRAATNLPAPGASVAPAPGVAEAQRRARARALRCDGRLLATQSRRLVPRAPGGLRLGDHLDAELASAQQRSGGWADHRPGGLLGRPNRAMRLVGGIGLFSERLGLGLGLLVPGLVECRGSPAHGAVSVSVVAVKLERPFENLGAAPGLVGVGSCKLLFNRRSLAGAGRRSRIRAPGWVPGAG